MTVIDDIKAFLKEWPAAEFGPAHIVLSDYNLEDGHIKWCIGLAHGALAFPAHDLSPDDVDFMSRVDWYRQCDREEMAATVVFLSHLLTIPEQQREEAAEGHYGTT